MVVNIIDPIYRYHNIIKPNETEDLFILFLPYATGVRYFIHVEIIIPKDSAKKQAGCEILIEDSNGMKILETKFYNKYKQFITTENCELDETPFIFATLKYKLFDFEDPVLIFFDLFEIQDFFIDPLNCSEERKEELRSIINNYLNPVDDDYSGVIEKISIFGEYLAKEFAKKACKRQIRQYRDAVNLLCSYKMTKNTKINYPYMGSLLWSLYYVRNQKLHPYSIIQFDKRLAETLLSILTQILHYTVDKKCRF